MTSVGRQGELRYEKEIPAYIGQTYVHPAGIIAENTVFEYFVEQFLRRLGIIVRAHTHKRQQTVPDGCDDRAFNPHFGLQDSLQERNHGTLYRRFVILRSAMRGASAALHRARNPAATKGANRS